MMLVPLDFRLVSLGRDSRDDGLNIDGRFGSLSDMSEELFDEGLDSMLSFAGVVVIVMGAKGSEGVGMVS